MVDHCGTYGLHFTFSKGCHHCHAAFKDSIKRALDATKISIHLETTGLYQSNGKQAYRASIVPWRWESAGVGCQLLRYTCTFVHNPGHKGSGCDGKRSREEEEEAKYAEVEELRPESHSKTLVATWRILLQSPYFTTISEDLSDSTKGQHSCHPRGIWPWPSLGAFLSYLDCM